MTNTELIALVVGIISLMILILFALLYLRRRKYHIKGKKTKNSDGSTQQLTQAKVYSSNERLDGARVSHRREHPDRISEEMIWKQKKERATSELQKKVDSERKNKMLLIYSPCNADVTAVHENLEEATTDGYEKPGMLLTPNDDKLYAPISGIVTWNQLDDSVVKIKSEDGTEVMLQCKYKEEESVGKKEFFTMKVNNQVMITTGEILCRFQNGMIRRNNKSIQIRMEISNYQEGQLLIVKKTNYVSHGDKVLTLRLES